MKNKYKNKELNREQCIALLNAYGTPAHVIGHCKGVCDTALKIAKALNDHGYDLNLDIIQRAALLHDIARVEKEHWEIGAKLLYDLGFEEEGNIVQAHMTYSTDPENMHFKEIDIVCMADKMVKEDQFVGYYKRMSSILEKFKDNDAAKERIQRRMAELEIIVKNIENIIGMPLGKLIEQ